MPDNVKDNPVEKREALLVDRLRLHKGYRQRLGRGRGKEGRWLRDGRLVFLDTPRFRRVSPWRGRLRSLRLGAARP